MNANNSWKVGKAGNFRLLFSVVANSAVSTMLRLQEFPVTDASGSEQCGYGNLQKAVTAADVWGLDGACEDLATQEGWPVSGISC